MMLGSKLRSWVETHLTRSKRKKNKRTANRPAVDEIQWSPPPPQSVPRTGRSNAPLVFHLQQEAAAKGQTIHYHGRNSRAIHGENDHQVTPGNKEGGIIMSTMQLPPATPVHFQHTHGRSPVATLASSHHLHNEPQQPSNITYHTPPALSLSQQGELPYWTRLNESALSSPRPRTSIRTNPWVLAHGRRSPKLDSVLAPSPLWNRRSCDSVETESSSGVTGSLHSPYSAESESSARDSAIGSDLMRDSNSKLSSNTLTPEEEDLHDSNVRIEDNFVPTFSLHRVSLESRLECPSIAMASLGKSDGIKENLRSQLLPLPAQEISFTDIRQEEVLDTVCRQVQHAYQATSPLTTTASITNTPVSSLSPSSKCKPDRDAQFYQLIQDTEQVLRQLELDELNLRPSTEEPLRHFAKDKVLLKERSQSQTEQRKKRSLPYRTRTKVRASPSSANIADSSSDTDEGYSYRHKDLLAAYYVPPQSEPAKRKVYRKSVRHDSPRPLSPTAEKDLMYTYAPNHQQQRNYIRPRSRRSSNVQCHPVHQLHSCGISSQHSCPTSPAIQTRETGPSCRSRKNLEECIYANWAAGNGIYPCATDMGSFSMHSNSSRQPSPSPSPHSRTAKSNSSSWQNSFEWEQQQQMQEELLALRKYLRDALIENDCPFPVDRYV